MKYLRKFLRKDLGWGIGGVLNLLLAASLMLPYMSSAAPAEMITICHATSSAINPFVTIHVSANATAGHFDNNGTTLAGHEGDFIINEPNAECPTTAEDNDNDDTGTLVVRKVVVGGTAQASDFSLHVMDSGDTEVDNSPQPGNTTGTSYNLNGGVYTVSETGGPAGYTASFVGCTSGGEITVVVDQTATCVVTNTFNNDTGGSDTGTLVVQKVVSGGDAVAGDFMIHVKNDADTDVATSPQAGNTTGTSYTLAPGTYSISESGGPSNFNASFSSSCSGGSVTVVAGQTVTCTVTNTFGQTAASADVGITKTINNSAPTSGSNVTYTVTVTNNSATDSAVNVNVADLLPTGVNFTSSVVSTGSYNSGTGAWTIGSMNSGASATLVVLANVTAASATTVNNTATVSSDNDSNSANNTASASLTVAATDQGGVATADLMITKSVNDDSPQSDDSVTYTITVTNNGPDNATGVIVNDVLPAGVNFTSSIVSTGSFNSATGVWTIGNLNNGASATMSIVADVTADDNDSVTNTATVLGSQEDDDSSNNTDTADFTVNNPSNGGGGGGSSSGSRVIGGGSSNNGQVLGETDVTSIKIPNGVTPQVLGETTDEPAVLGESLPRTGTKAYGWLLLLVPLSAVWVLKRRTGNIS